MVPEHSAKAWLPTGRSTWKAEYMGSSDSKAVDLDDPSTWPATLTDFVSEFAEEPRLDRVHLRPLLAVN